MTIDPIFIIKFLASFLFYFIGGYLLYASLFAAIGAAVDSETDSQQFLTPLSIILVIGLYIGFAAMKSPESPMVFWSSLIPFTSPIVMLVRIPFGVPTWEILTSMALLIVSFIFFTWLSGKIYRIGILMYGKKVTWKELYKWLKYYGYSLTTVTITTNKIPGGKSDIKPDKRSVPESQIFRPIRIFCVISVNPQNKLWKH